MDDEDSILVENSIYDIPKIVSRVRDGFRSFKTLDISFRRTQLKNLQRMIKENEGKFVKALNRDLNKSEADVMLTEFQIVNNDLIILLDELDDLTSPQPHPRDLLNKFNSIYTQAEPYGVVLVIAPWNFPYHLVVLPLMGAIAAGNCCIVKPSEATVAMSNLFAELLPQYLDQNCYAVITGGVDCSKAVLRERYDYIFYTGSTNVGKVVMKQAAENLTPVTLELGGKSPVLVAPDANIDVCARRVIWAKCINAGQACLAPDHVLCLRDQRDKLVSAMKTTIAEFYGENPRESKDYPRIVNSTHFKRLTSLLQRTRGKVVLGGESDEGSRYISPTVVTDVANDDELMQGEIFGPILPVVAVDSVEQAIKIINDREKPLVMYVFTESSEVFQDISEKTSSGAVCHNDCMMHYTVPSLPFGGVGHSGMGAYHGVETFKTFSHYKPVFSTGTGLEALNKIRYPPYSLGRLKQLRWLLSPSRKSKFPWKLFFAFLLVLVVAVLFQKFPDWK